VTVERMRVASRPGTPARSAAVVPEAAPEEPRDLSRVQDEEEGPLQRKPHEPLLWEEVLSMMPGEAFVEGQQLALAEDRRS
jgi:hypothetical protein